MFKDYENREYKKVKNKDCEKTIEKKGQKPSQVIKRSRIIKEQ